MQGRPGSRSFYVIPGFTTTPANPAIECEARGDRRPSDALPVEIPCFYGHRRVLHAAGAGPMAHAIARAVIDCEQLDVARDLIRRIA